MGPAGSSVKQEDTTANGGMVTLGRGEFDFLCRKLHALESSISDLRRELGFKAHHGDESLTNGESADGMTNIDPAVDGRAARRPTHTDIHGVHVKNDAVSISSSSSFPFNTQ